MRLMFPLIIFLVSLPPDDGSDLSVGEKEFLTKYRSLPEESQEYVSQLIDMIYKIENKSSEKAE